VNDTGYDDGKRPYLSPVSIATLAITLTGLLAFAPVTGARAKELKPMVMFVQLAEELKVDPTSQTLRLAKVGQQTIYFADRPERLAGHIRMADYLNEWTSKGGSDNFHNNPPNASVSVFEADKATNTLAVITISNPTVEGADLIYSYGIVGGALPTTGGATSLFIDWIGLSQGNGAGFVPWD
jgi:hypothetical protein